MLDELPYGTFVEIEGEDIATLQHVSSLLGLKWGVMVKAGYHALFERVTDKHQLKAGELSFEALSGVQITPEDLNIIPAD
jgi:hypothetical protein